MGKMKENNRLDIPRHSETPQRKPPRLEGVVQNRGIKKKKKEKKIRYDALT